MLMKDLYWLAGLLEGEGCFTAKQKYHYPVIDLSMTDKDVVERAAALLGTKVNRFPKRQPHWKDQWNTRLCKQKAVHGWLLTLFSLMGKRRKARIATLLRDAEYAR